MNYCCILTTWGLKRKPSELGILSTLHDDFYAHGTSAVGRLCPVASVTTARMVALPFYRVAQKSKPPPIFQKNRIKDCQRD